MTADMIQVEGCVTRERADAGPKSDGRRVDDSRTIATEEGVLRG